LIQIDLQHPHPDSIAKPVCISWTVATQGVGGTVVAIAVIWQISNSHKAFSRQLNSLHEQAEAFHSRHHTIEFEANSITQKVQQLQLHQFPLCRFCPTLQF
jgi:hypothetical protein